MKFLNALIYSSAILLSGCDFEFEKFPDYRPGDNIPIGSLYVNKNAPAIMREYNESGCNSLYVTFNSPDPIKENGDYRVIPEDIEIENNPAPIECVDPNDNTKVIVYNRVIGKGMTGQKYGRFTVRADNIFTR